jgi:hypothetical protein
MKHRICKVTSVEVAGPHRLRVGFDDGLVREIDFLPVLAGAMLAPLRDPALFSQVQIDPEAHTLVWPSGADFDPAMLHDWPEYVGALNKWARELERQTA